ncbi:hypothetical protein FJY90_02365 [Candidatus Gottesmanbacteria bacterium]|nr:hypothetical protein [Candidatus Gottesmanbacteria bacterium]
MTLALILGFFVGFGIPLYYDKKNLEIGGLISGIVAIGGVLLGFASSLGIKPLLRAIMHQVPIERAEYWDRLWWFLNDLYIGSPLLSIFLFAISTGAGLVGTLLLLKTRLSRR